LETKFSSTPIAHQPRKLYSLISSILWSFRIKYLFSNMYQQTAISCTLNNVPMTASALQKSRLPFAIHIYPFAQDETIPIISGSIIVRCRVCRAYINPYIRFTDQMTWQCNLCNRFNQLQPQFMFDESTRQYYDLGSKKELTSETVEYVAGEEYMIRPPQPACYMFVFDCSKAAIELGYIPVMASAIADLLDQMPGDARASIGFIAFDSNIHYFSFSGTQVVHHVCADVSAEVTPCSIDGILANMTSKREMILDFVTQNLPNFPLGRNPNYSADPKSALGPAVMAAMRVLSRIGGRITVIQAQLPNHGALNDGSVLARREDPSFKKTTSIDKNGNYLTSLLSPATDFYRNLGLECCEHQISTDLFNLSTSYADLASVSPLAKYSSGTVFHYSNSPAEHTTTLIRFDQDFRNNLVRPIGLESVLRMRFTKGLKIHSFHGNFFVRSPNLLVLPNANPDASFALQMAIEDDLKPDVRNVYFQASILYTTPEGERRIRVHTARYPTVPTLPEIIYGANQTAIVAILAKMAVDRSLQASIGDAKEALIGAGVDLLEIYSIADEMRARSYSMGLPENLRLVPLYILALLKHCALKINNPIPLDDRSAAMERFKTLPIDDLITYIYPDLFPLHNIAIGPKDDWKNPMQLTAAHIERNGAYLLDAYDVMMIYICEYIDPSWCHAVFDVTEYSMIPEQCDFNIQQPIQRSTSRPRDPSNFTNSANSTNITSHYQPASSQMTTMSISADTPLVKLPELENAISIQLREFINCLLDSRPQKPKFYILKENSKSRGIFTQYLLDDRSENYHSYAEFWKFLQDQARK